MDPALPESRIEPGTRIGNQTVRGLLSSDPIGDRYETVFGTTSHKLDLVVGRGGSPDGYRDYLDRTAPVRDCPCLIRYFAAGEENGMPWLRADHADGAPDWTFQTKLDDKVLPYDEEEEIAFVPTLADLLAAARGKPLAGPDRDKILGDVFEGLAALHAAQLHCGSFVPGSVSLAAEPLDTDRPLAKLRLYGWPVSTPELRAADLPLAAELVRTVAPGCKPLLAFADQLAGGAFPSATEANDALQSVLRKLGHPHAKHFDPEAAVSQAEHAAAQEYYANQVAADKGPSTLTRLASLSESARRAVGVLRVILVLIGFAALGAILYLVLLWTDSQGKSEYGSTALASYSAITVIPLSEDEIGGDVLAAGGLPADVFDCSTAQIDLAAESGNPLAVARKTIEGLLSEDGKTPTQDAVKAASDAIGPILDAVADLAADNPSAALLEGYARLLGLGTERDPEEAKRLLTQALEAGSPRAGILLGDWYASEVPVPGEEAVGRSERSRRALAAYRGALALVRPGTPLFGQGAARAVHVLRTTPDLAKDFGNDYLPFVQTLARSGSLPALLLLANPGGIVPDVPAETMKTLRTIEGIPGIPDPIRGWACCRMGATFESGKGYVQSDSAARLWYGRAAELGNAEAIDAMIRFCETGRGTDAQTPDPAAAESWKTRRAQAVAVPEFFPKPAVLLSVRENAPAVKKAVTTKTAVQKKKKTDPAKTKSGVSKFFAPKAPAVPTALTPLTPSPKKGGKKD